MATPLPVASSLPYETIQFVHECANHNLPQLAEEACSDGSGLTKDQQETVRQ